MRLHSSLKVLGLTGGAGTGKSTVTAFLEELGAKVISADAISRQISQIGCEAYDDILSAFGTEILTEDKDIDRRKLGEIVFNDKAKLAELNSITHKHIANKICCEIEKAKGNAGYKAIVVDAALPLKHGFLDVCDVIWVVAADESLRIERLVARSNYTRDKALSIIKAQMSEHDYKRLADTVIDNNSDIDDLKNRVKVLWDEFIYC